MFKKPIMSISIAVLLIAPSIYALTGCLPHKGSEDQLKNDADSFATYYYNWHFPEAIKYCTPESERWLRYAASNVHEADIMLLRQKAEDATIEIKDIDFADDGKSAYVTLSVYNFLQMDTIGQAAHLVEQADLQLPMELHEGIWKAKLTSSKMVDLRQNERQNHGSTSDE